MKCSLFWAILPLTVILPSHAWGQANTPVPATFFTMSAVEQDYPKVLFGTLGHQGFAWVTMERTKGKFDFQAFDNYMAAAQAHGLVDSATNTANFAMTLAAGTPGWAVADQQTCNTGTAGVTVCTAPPDNIQDWKDFLTALTQHYNGQTQPHIKYYELWNEFNIPLWWTGTDAQMLALAQAAYPIIHQDPYSVLLTPSVAGAIGPVQADSGVVWMTRYLQAGGSKYADAGAFHGYTGGGLVDGSYPMPEQDSTAGCKGGTVCFGSIITRSAQMRAVFDQNGLAGKPMYQTEGSWGNMNITDLDTQIAWLARWNLLQAGLRSSLDLQMADWFTWGGGTTFGWGDLEDASLQPTAAGLAYNQVFNWVVGATISQPCSGAANGTWTCTLARPNGYIAQAAWNTQGSASYTPGPGYAQYRDLAGNTMPIAAGASIPIGAKPVLVETPGTLPHINNGGIVIHAGASGIASPGSLVDIYGLNLAAAAASAPAGPMLPATLGKVQVLVNGTAAPLIYVGPQQIIFQLPYETALGTASVVVVSNNLSSAPAPLTVQQAAPFVLTYGNNNNRAVVVNPDSSVNGSGNGAKPGSVLVAYLIGSGPLDNAIATGVVAPDSPLSREKLATTVSVGGANAALQFAGMTPGFAGLVQVNFVLPDLAPGDYPLEIGIGGAASNQPLLTVAR